MEKCNECVYDYNENKVRSCNKCNANFQLSKLTEKYCDDFLKICNDNGFEFKEPIITTFDVCNALTKQLEQSKFKPHHIKYIDENGKLVEITKQL